MKLLFIYKNLVLVLLFFLLSLIFGVALQAQTAKEWYTSAMLKMINGEHEAAIVDFTKAYRRDKTMIDAVYNRGIARERIGDYDHAIDDYSIVIKAKPNNFQAFNNRGLLYLRMEEYDKALDDFKTSLRINDHAITYLYLANTYMQLKQYSEAKVNATKVLDYLPNYFRAHHILAQVNFFEKIYEESLKHYNFLCGIQAPKAIYFLERSAVYFAMNKPTEAWSDYNKAKELGCEDAATKLLEFGK
jgi:tetratricopeptide (TPR) repeat protein